ncbi:MAG TPA: biopolymer transporter ExbD [Gemmataceae bacterium]|jgi:biopolymer transport protein ExbD|nr:biopolymer transporter ExbD [Gemmataceae bacterium]
MKFKRRKLECPPPYVAMADIAFNLVLFFVIMAKTQDDKHIQWQPAKAKETQQAKNARVRVSVDQNSKVYLNGKEIGIRNLAEQVAIFLGDNHENRTVLLKIHKDTLASTFEPIMEAVSQAGGDVVHVLEEER